MSRIQLAWAGCSAAYHLPELTGYIGDKGGGGAPAPAEYSLPGILDGPCPVRLAGGGGGF